MFDHSRASGPGRWHAVPTLGDALEALSSLLYGRRSQTPNVVIEASRTDPSEYASLADVRAEIDWIGREILTSTSPPSTLPR